jgi:hypothetical protein
MVENGDGNPMLRYIPAPGLRRSITGFLLGTVGALIALSPLGQARGAHINPLVTVGFFQMEGRFESGPMAEITLMGPNPTQRLLANCPELPGTCAVQTAS